MYMSSISFHLKSCPQMNNLTSVCTHRQAHCSTAIIHSRFIMFLAKLLQHLLLQDIFILLIFPATCFLSFVLFFLQTFPAGLKAQCHAWSMTTTVLPAENCIQSQVKTKFMCWGPIIECAAPCRPTCHLFTVLWSKEWEKRMEENNWNPQFLLSAL